MTSDVAGIVDEISDEVLAALDARTQIPPIAARRSGFDLDIAYRVNARVSEKRRARGETVIGRKLGFTNRNIWDEYKVYAPIWSYVYDTTVRNIAPAGDAFDLGRVIEPRIEPEITLGLKRAPEPGMDAPALMECLDFVAPGSRSSNRCFRAGGSRPQTRSLHSACTVH